MFSIKFHTTNFFTIAINVDALYSFDKDEIRRFYERFASFMDSSSDNNFVYKKTKKGIQYDSQNLLPIKEDIRMPVLIVLGNPAPQSVREKVIFAYEGKNKIHRMWKVLFDTGVLRFSDNIDDYANFPKNELLKSLTYISPFRVGFYSFFSAPSPSSEKQWSGVAGIKKLFGLKAFKKISIFEQERFQTSTERFLHQGGKVLCFQKDSYDLIKEDILNKIIITASNTSKSQIEIIAMPPTRLLYSSRSKNILKSLIPHST